MYGTFLAGGVRIFEYRPAMLHAKTMVVDGAWCTVGSINLDARSLRCNEEANLNTCDESFACEMESVFMSDLEDADEITPVAWRRRPFMRRCYETSASLIRDLL